VILNIKCYILHPIPSKLVLPKSVVASVAIYHQMVVIQIQVWKKIIKNVLLNGGSKVNIIIKKVESVVRFVKTKTHTLQPTHG
jgi:hypothetical protein